METKNDCFHKNTYLENNYWYFSLTPFKMYFIRFCGPVLWTVLFETGRSQKGRSSKVDGPEFQKLTTQNGWTTIFGLFGVFNGIASEINNLKIVFQLSKKWKSKIWFPFGISDLVIKRDRNRMTFGTNFSLFIFGFRCG